MVMKKYLVGMGLLLSVNGVLADNSGLEQSMKNMLTSAREKQSTSELRVAQATQGTGPLLLRDAIYLYNLPIYAGNLQSLFGFGCDIFQLVLDVGNGYTDIAISEGVTSASGGNIFIYPDRIYDNAAMFAYALYSSNFDKGFSLADAKLNETTNVDPNTIVGHATAFGYCFSTNPSAAVVYCKNDVCHLSSEINP